VKNRRFHKVLIPFPDLIIKPMYWEINKIGDRVSTGLQVGRKRTKKRQDRLRPCLFPKLE
jgi:hypothetical protein